MGDDGLGRRAAAIERRRSFAPLFAPCDRSRRRVVEVIEPPFVVGSGRFAEGRAREALADTDVRVGCILHASPAANCDWAGIVARQLRELGACPPPRATRGVAGSDRAPG